MPLSADRLATSVKNSLSAKGFKFKDGEPNTDFISALCNAVVAEIKANAVVSGPITVVSVAGVTTGAGVSGAGSGTLSNGVIS